MRPPALCPHKGYPPAQHDAEKAGYCRGEGCSHTGHFEGLLLETDQR